MNFTKWMLATALASSFVACADPAPQATNPIVGDVTECTPPNEEEELIGSALYSDPDIQPGEYRVVIIQEPEEDLLWSMYYRVESGKAPWGGLTSKLSNSDEQYEGHDEDGDGDAEWHGCELEQHVLPNGVYSITFKRGSTVLFERSVAMLDDRGVAMDIEGSAVYQDVDVKLDLAAPTTVTMTGWFGQSTTYTQIYDQGIELGNFSQNSLTIPSGDTAWFVSTYLASGSPTRPWYGEQRAVLNSFNFDYDRNGLFGPATNSFPRTNNLIPVAHVFAAPGASSSFTVRLRTVLPHHASNNTGILVPQTMSVTVVGDPVSFTTSANPTTNQPVTFTAATLAGEAFFEYSWDFGEGPGSGWSSAYKQIQHTYTQAGQKTVTLSVRNLSGEGPTVGAQQNVSVVDPPLLVTPIRGAYQNQNGAVRWNETCIWSTSATGGSGTYTYTWYKNNVQVGTTQFLELFAGTQGFTLKVVVQSGSQSVEKTKSISVTAGGQFCF